MQQDARGLPATYVQALAAPESQCAGWHPTGQAAWHYPAAALAPRAVRGRHAGRQRRRAAPQHPRGRAAPERHRLAAVVRRWPRAGRDRPVGPGWRPCAARCSPRSTPRWAELITQRGQISRVALAPARLGTALAGDGYAIDAGLEGFWCGATTQDVDPDPQLRRRPCDNLARLDAPCWASLCPPRRWKAVSAGDC